MTSRRSFPRAKRIGLPRDQSTAAKIQLYRLGAGDRRRWWWPDPPPDDEGYYWPPGVSNEETVAAFVAAFATLGYIPCDGDRVEAGQQRIALYAAPDGVPTHAARQLPNGRWTSKLGRWEDIEHRLPHLEGETYGAIVTLMSITTTTLVLLETANALARPAWPK